MLICGNAEEIHVKRKVGLCSDSFLDIFDLALHLANTGCDATLSFTIDAHAECMYLFIRCDIFCWWNQCKV